MKKNNGFKNGGSFLIPKGKEHEIIMGLSGCVMDVRQIANRPVNYPLMDGLPKIKAKEVAQIMKK